MKLIAEVQPIYENSDEEGLFEMDSEYDPMHDLISDMSKMEIE